MADGRGRATATGALGGAMSGAGIGTAVGGPVGTAVGAGIGALVGGTQSYLGSAPTEYEKYTQEKLDELKRREELGLLGLTDEELSAMGYELGGAINRERAMTQSMLRQAGASGGLGPEAFARQAAGAEAQMGAISAEAQHQINIADLQKKQAEESEMYELLALQYDIDASEKMLAAQREGMYLSAAVDMADMLGEKSWYGEQEIEKSGYTAADQEAAGKGMEAFLRIFGDTGK
jgi:hypothetical protein